jgi:peptidoglycan/LPS O-acetylase OafA/YrhL
MAIHGASNVNWSRPDLRWDALLMGCVLALVWDNPRARDRLQALAGKHGWVLLLLGLGGLTFPWGIESATHGVTGMMGSTVKLTGICLLLLTAVTRAIRPLAALLDWRPVRWLGRISYSLYLWQQAFCFGTQGRWFESFPTNLALTFVAASLSYYLVEQPFLRLRGRILDSRSHSRIGTAVAPN